MSYIAFDLDALNACPSVARAAQVPEDAVSAGLLRLWAHCFRAGQSVLDALVVRGAFNAESPALLPSLVAFGFLEEVPGGLRVRGAERYLRVQEGRRKGGKAASGNLKKGKTAPKRASAGGGAGASSRLVSGLSPAAPPADPRLVSGLSPSTEHRAPTTESTTGAGVADAPPPPVLELVSEPTKAADPRHRPTLEALAGIFEQARGAKLHVTGRTAKEVQGLLAAGNACAGPEDAPYEVVRRWRLALASSRYPLVSTPGELLRTWDHWAGAGPPSGGYDPNQGIMRNVGGDA